MFTNTWRHFQTCTRTGWQKEPQRPGLSQDDRPGAKTIKKNTNSTQNKSQTHRAKQYKVTSFLSTDCELSTETCSKNVYSLGPWSTLTQDSSGKLSDLC